MVVALEVVIVRMVCEGANVKEGEGGKGAKEVKEGEGG